jgi:hypothetical protein
MSESASVKQRQTSMAYSNIGNLPLPPGSHTGSTRSRRSSWSDSKVRNNNNKNVVNYLYFFFIESLEYW